MNKEISKAMTQGIVFKKAKDKAKGPSGRRIKFSDFLRGTHGSDSVKWKAGFKYKKALHSSKERK